MVLDPSCIEEICLPLAANPTTPNLCSKRLVCDPEARPVEMRVDAGSSTIVKLSVPPDPTTPNGVKIQCRRGVKR